MEAFLVLRVLMAGLLYLFLGVAIYVMWRGLATPESTAEEHPPAQLVVEAGQAAPARLALRPISAIGRAADNHLVLEDPYASTHHAIVLWRDARWWLEDLESHNGTYLNGERLDAPTPLVSGDQIRIGEAVVRFEAGLRPEVNPADA